MSTLKRIFCIGLVVALLVVGGSNLASADDKPFIFINSASELGFGSGTNFGLVVFSEFARANGFNIDHGVRASFADGTALEGVDVMVFFDPNFPMTTEDKIALRQWVRAGGILITGEWYTPNTMNGFLNEFGIDILPRTSSNRHISIPAGSPLSGPQKPNDLIARGGTSLDILDSSFVQVMARFEDGDVAITRTIKNAGKGEIITVGCLRMLYDTNFSISGDIELQDNKMLIRNLVVYLKDKLKQENADLNLFKLKTKGGSSFNPGDSIKFVAKIRNIGKVQGEATNIAFYLEKTGSAPSARIEITTANVPAVKTSKKIKIVKKTFLPNSLAPGNYNVIAVVDPDGDTDDGNTGNNTTTTKKKIVIQ